MLVNHNSSNGLFPPPPKKSPKYQIPNTNCTYVFSQKYTSNQNRNVHSEISIKTEEMIVPEKTRREGWREVGGLMELRDAIERDLENWMGTGSSGLQKEEVANFNKLSTILELLNHLQ